MNPVEPKSGFRFVSPSSAYTLVAFMPTKTDFKSVGKAGDNAKMYMLKKDPAFVQKPSLILTADHALAQLAC